jgi:hypothetical protein
MSETYKFQSDVKQNHIIDDVVGKLQKKFKNKYSSLIEYKVTPKIKDIISFLGIETKRKVYDHEITVHIPVVQWEGYTYIATLKKEVGDEKTNQVFAINNEEDFSRYFEAEFRCDHCKTHRFRKTVHIFRKETGEELMIASSCAKEYFGIDVAGELRKIFNLLYRIRFSDDLEEFGRCYRYIEPLDTPLFMKYCYAVIKSTGMYVSKKMEEGSSTVEKAAYLNFGKGFTNQEKEYLKEQREKVEELTKDFNPENVYEYWKNKNDYSTFTNNVQVALEMLDPQQGLIAWAVYEYMKEVEQFGQATKNITQSEHVGEKGKRVDFKINVLGIREFDSSYSNGKTYLIEMTDDKGNILNWWASNPHSSFEEGAELSIKGTIKDHKEYKGKKITLINRCKVSS